MKSCALKVKLAGAEFLESHGFVQFGQRHRLRPAVHSVFCMRVAEVLRQVKTAAANVFLCERYKKGFEAASVRSAVLLYR